MCADFDYLCEELNFNDCITVDHETPNDHKVTLRYRDTMEQERVAISDLRSIIEERVSITSVLQKICNEIKNF